MKPCGSSLASRGSVTRCSPPKTSSAMSWCRASSQLTTRRPRASASPVNDADFGTVAVKSVPPLTRPPRPGREKPLSRGRETQLLIDVMVQSARWRTVPQAAAIVRKAIRAAASTASTPRAELAIVLTDDSAIHALNREWRGHDAPTNVLSFPAPDFRPVMLAAEGRGGSRRNNARRSRQGTAGSLGDIVIAFQTTAREARTEGKPLEHHLAHLAVHGFLHLVGYDHETDRDANRMESLETKILAGLGVPNPHGTRSAARHATS